MVLPEFLFHYYELENGPFRNITQNKPKKAKEILNNMSEGILGKRPPNYIELRFAVEKRLKEGFLIKGGKPKRNDPFYFTLGECKWLESVYVNPGIVKIPLANLKPEDISFTYPDSMMSFQFYDEPRLKRYRKEYNGTVFSLDEIKKVIKEHGLPSVERCESQEEMKYDKYIEVQLWDDSAIKEHQQIDLFSTKNQLTKIKNSPEKINAELNKLLPKLIED